MSDKPTKRVKVLVEEYEEMSQGGVELGLYSNTQTNLNLSQNNLSPFNPSLQSQIDLTQSNELHSNLAQTDIDLDAAYNAPGADIVKYIARLAILRSLNGRVIRRAQLLDGFDGDKAQFGSGLVTTNAILDRMGLKIVESNTVAGPKKAMEYLLVSSLSSKEKGILHKLWVDLSTIVLRKRVSDDAFFLASTERDPLPLENLLLVYQGVVAVVLALVIVENSHLNKAQLVKQLVQLGLVPNIDAKNTSIDHNVQTLLLELEKTLYLKTVFSSNTSAVSPQNIRDEYVFYTLGKRAITEFTPALFYGFIQALYGDDFDATVRDKTLLTLEKAFKRSFEDEFAQIQEPNTQSTQVQNEEGVSKKESVEREEAET